MILILIYAELAEKATKGASIRVDPTERDNLDSHSAKGLLLCDVAGESKSAVLFRDEYALVSKGHKVLALRHHRLSQLIREGILDEFVYHFLVLGRWQELDDLLQVGGTRDVVRDYGIDEICQTIEPHSGLVALVEKALLQHGHLSDFDVQPSATVEHCWPSEHKEELFHVEFAILISDQVPILFLVEAADEIQNHLIDGAL